MSTANSKENEADMAKNPDKTASDMESGPINGMSPFSMQKWEKVRIWNNWHREPFCKNTKRLSPNSELVYLPNDKRLDHY